MSNNLSPLLITGALAFCGIARAANDDVARAQLMFFENEIRPLLAQHCYKCHGEEKQKGGLRLDHIADILEGGDTGPAVVRGKPDESLLIQAVRGTHEDISMPPKETLPEADVARLEKWVALGAPWPETAVARSKPKAEVDEYGFTAEDRAYWAFQPIANPTPPRSVAEHWVANDIDRFVAAKHAEHGLSPAPEASREELLRRLTFDLHGLPPTRAQLEAFINDPSPDAYARLVDSLLASPRYGERWAQHWLDLVRYAESDGYRADAYRPGAWPYRDYVIKSFNSDKPYDQFVREQLAGDEIAPDDPEVLIATSYLRNPIYEWNQTDVRGQREIILTDITDNAGEVFLGLSVGCARCHDHKFDPILQKDYFSLRAFFEPVVGPRDLTLATPAERAAHAAQLAKWEEATAEIRRERDALLEAALKKNVRTAYNRFPEELQKILDMPAAERTPDLESLAVLAERMIYYEHERFEPLKAVKTPEDKAKLDRLDAALKKFDHLKPKPLLPAFVARDVGPVAPPTKMKGRKGERDVDPAFLTLLDPSTPEIAALPKSTGRRTALAQWLTRPDHPLVPRVIVNRVWQYHFGRGLAATPNDFGRLGQAPTHPELLDWLTRRFVAGGWKLKSLHRDILLSATYRQTARVPVSERAALIDPEIKFLWRHSPRRLDAEQVRDAILAATGELDLTAGGPPQDANLSVRRTIYTIKKRNSQNELLRVLDAPAGFTSTADRQRTSTPLQALFLMNGDWVLARSRHLGANANSIDETWQAVLGRAPTPAERTLAESFLARQIAAAKPLPDSPERAPIVASDAGLFHENTAQERLLVRNAPKEGDDFTIEAVISPDSVDTRTAVRTIVSRWTGEKNTLESHGWSLGIAGEKSPLGARTLVLQLVGEDENMNTTYEALPSGLTIEPGKTYRVAVRISTVDRTATFLVRDAATPNEPPRTATLKHAVVAKLGTGQAQPVIGGLYRRSPHQFDGRIAAVRVVFGHLPDATLLGDPATWPAGGLVWRATDSIASESGSPAPVAPTSGLSFAWSGGTNAESRDPRTRAMADLSHVLLNANEFFYLH